MLAVNTSYKPKSISYIQFYFTVHSTVIDT